MRIARRRLVGQGRLQGRSRGAQARREEGPGRARADQRAGGVGPQAGRYRHPGSPAAGPCHHAGAAAAAAADRGLRQQPYPGHQRGRRHDRGRTGRLHQEPVPKIQHQVRGPDARGRLRHDAGGAAATIQAAADLGGSRRRKEGQGTDKTGGGRRDRFRNGPTSSSSTAAVASSMRPRRSSTPSACSRSF